MLAGLVRDQVLADLDEGVGEAARRGMPVDRVARKAAAVGLVVADGQPGRVGPKRGDQRCAQPLVPVVRMPTSQGRATPRQNGVKLCMVRIIGGPAAASAAATAASIARSNGS